MDDNIQGAAFTVPQGDLKKGNVPDTLQPFSSLNNVIFAPMLGKPMAVAHKKNVQALARSVIDFLLMGDLSLAVNPPDVYDKSLKDHFPMAVHDMRSSVPLKL